MTKETYAKLFSNDNLKDELPFEFIYVGEPVNDLIPTEDEIVTALFKMRNQKAPGLTKIAVDDLKKWYHDAHTKENEEAEIDP